MIIAMPTHKKLDSYRDTEDENRLLSKIFDHPFAITLPKEYEAYIKRRGRVYRVELSQSNFSWVLSMDDGTWGHDQPGWYLRTLVLLRNGDINEALRRAKILLPEETAFFVPDGYDRERRPEDAAFDEWFNDL